jgi:hypothetical protein
MRRDLFAGALLSSVLFLGAVDAGAQKDRTDALIAAPASHKVLFENARVRVLEVVIPPGVTEPAHTHAWPGVMRFESPQPLTYITYAAQAGKLNELKRYEVPMGKAGQTEWSEPEGLHAVQNRGTTVFRAVRIELKPTKLDAR